MKNFARLFVTTLRNIYGNFSPPSIDFKGKQKSNPKPFYVAVRN